MKHRIIHLMLLWMLVLTPAFLACESSSESDNNPGADGDAVTGCKTNADCFSPSTNNTCNRLEGTCIDHGTCGSNGDCLNWYGSELPNCEKGLCVAVLVDGDGESSTEGSDNVLPDGDKDSEEGCSDFSGVYTMESTCMTANDDVYVAVNYLSCDILVDLVSEQFSGKVSGDNITLDKGKNCSGSGVQGGDIDLMCGDCSVQLKRKQISTDKCDEMGQMAVRPTSLDFGSVGESAEAGRTSVITNDGKGALKITKLVFLPGTSEKYSIKDTSLWDTPVTIASGNDMELEISFYTDTALTEPENGMLAIYSDSCTQPLQTIALKTYPKMLPKIEIDPTKIIYGSSAPEFDNRRYFLIKNIGGAPAMVKSIELENTTQFAFRIEKIGENPPPLKGILPIEAGFTLAVTVNFRPIKDVHKYNETYVDHVKIVWADEDQNEQEVSVELVGNVSELNPPCLDIQPLEGGSDWLGMSDLPGPGIKFGYSQINAPTTREITFTNCGDEVLELTKFAMDPTFGSGATPTTFFIDISYFMENGQPKTYELGRGETVHMPVQFTPTGEGTLYTGGFKFETNATKFAWAPGSPPPSKQTQFYFSGIGAQRGIEVLPSKLDFGMVTIDCCSRPEEVSIYNIGDLPLEIKEIRVGVGSDKLFEVSNLPSLPIRLGGSGNPQSMSFDIRYCAKQEGPAVGRIEIVSDDANSKEFVVPVQGEGTTLTHQTDEFTQITHPMVDMLWVVDCSGSMGDEQDNLSDNFKTFITEAISWKADLHVAVASTDIIDPSHSGNFLGSPKILKNKGPGALTNDEMKTKFQDNIKVGTSCDSSQETALEAAHLALSAPLIDNENGGFLREDAKLSIVLVSDEEDQATADVPFFIDFFKSIKGMRNVNMLEVYAVCGDPSGGCSAPSGQEGGASAGKRYNAVAEACNPHEDEHFQSICEEDFSPMYKTMAENVFAKRNQFFLSRLADPKTIVVTVNGQPGTHWSYDDVTNSIIFEIGNEPDPGAKIIVDYDTLCLK